MAGTRRKPRGEWRALGLKRLSHPGLRHGCGCRGRRGRPLQRGPCTSPRGAGGRGGGVRAEGRGGGRGFERWFRASAGGRLGGGDGARRDLGADGCFVRRAGWVTWRAGYMRSHLGSERYESAQLAVSHFGPDRVGGWMRG